MSQKRKPQTVARRDEERRAAFHALELMRRYGWPRTRAAREAGISVAALMRHVGSALHKQGSRWVAKPADRLTRAMHVLTEGGVEHDVVVRGSRVASVIGGHWSAIGHYLGTGEASRLAGFRGKRVAGYTLETEPVAIVLWAHRGELDVEDIYSLTP